MKVLILCAGYGTRFVRDVEASSDPEVLALKDVPKPLLPVGNKPLIKHWIDQVSAMQQFDQIGLIVNDCSGNKFEIEALQAGIKEPKLLVLASDGSSKNEERIGAVACIKVGVDKCLGGVERAGHVLVIAGDTLFDSRFSLEEFIKEFETVNAKSGESASLIVHGPCPEERVHKHGIIETDEEGRVVNFLEKPSPEETSSRKQCPCFYILHNDHLRLLDEFLEDTKDMDLKARDATGNFLSFLIRKKPVYSHFVPKRYDVGGLESYLECCKDF